MVILAKISLEEKREIRFSSILELYSWEHFEEIKELNSLKDVLQNHMSNNTI